MVTIALDAMGGDHFPKPEVEGALQAAKLYDVRVILVGREDVILKELDRHHGWQRLPIEIRHASEQITMDDSAGKAVRAKKDSSIRVASRLVKTGEAQGVVSAGNTGAVMATAKMVQGMLRGVDRPALASAFPTVKGTSAVMLDVGANVDCTGKMLAQFAVMGSAYASIILKMRNPRVGLLSIGEEEHKGNELTHEAFPLIKALPHINFIGNVEGRDVYSGTVDVIVCDGFVGNVALKTSEGLSGSHSPHAARVDGEDNYPEGRRIPIARRICRIQKAGGLQRVWRRSAARPQRHLRHLPRSINHQSHRQCHPYRKGVCAWQNRRGRLQRNSVWKHLR